MNLLITGGAGFIGSHLAERLLGAGHRVTVIDDLSTGSLENIQHLCAHPWFRFIRDSVLDETLMRRLTRDVTAIYHLAAAVGVKYIIEHPLASIQTNIQATEIVLKCAV